MNKEIKDIIEKNLPAQVGEVLQEHLAKCDQESAENKRMHVELEKTNEARSRLLEQLQNYQLLDERNRTLEQREKDVSEKERDRKVFEAELKRDESEKRSNDLYSIVQLVFKSPVYKKTIANQTISDYQNVGWGGQDTKFAPIGEIVSEE